MKKGKTRRASHTLSLWTPFNSVMRSSTLILPTKYHSLFAWHIRDRIFHESFKSMYHNIPSGRRHINEVDRRSGDSTKSIADLTVLHVEGKGVELEMISVLNFVTVISGKSDTNRPKIAKGWPPLGSCRWSCGRRPGKPRQCIGSLKKRRITTVLCFENRNKLWQNEGTIALGKSGVTLVDSELQWNGYASSLRRKFTEPLAGEHFRLPECVLLHRYFSYLVEKWWVPSETGIRPTLQSIHSDQVIVMWLTNLSKVSTPIVQSRSFWG